MAEDPSPTSRAPVVDFDLFRHVTSTGSDDAWRALRKTCPAAWTEANGGHWVVAGYDAVITAFRDWETFSSARTDPTMEWLGWPEDEWILAASTFHEMAHHEYFSPGFNEAGARFGWLGHRIRAEVAERRRTL